jgi:hypothetical protein
MAILVQSIEPTRSGMRRFPGILPAAAALILLAGCAGDPVTIGPETPICPRAAIPAVAGDTVTLPSGVRYIDIREGEGAAVQLNQTVRVHYTGWLPDSTRFDTSRGGSAVNFPLGGLIAGFHQGAIGMQPGGERRIIIPPALGYQNSPRPCIPANSTLIFDVELLAIVGG